MKLIEQVYSAGVNSRDWNIILFETFAGKCINSFLVGTCLQSDQINLFVIVVIVSPLSACLGWTAEWLRMNDCWLLLNIELILYLITLKLDADIELDPIYATLDFIKLHFKSSQNQHKSEKWTNANYAKLSNFV